MVSILKKEIQNLEQEEEHWNTSQDTLELSRNSGTY